MAMEEDIKNSEIEFLKTHLNGLLEIISGNYWFKDVDGHYLGANMTFAKQLGFDAPDEVFGKTDFELPWAEQAENLIKNDRQVMASKKVHRYEELVRDASGHEHCFLVTKMPLVSSEGEILGTIGTSIDITNEKKVTHLEQQKRDAEQKSQFLRAAAASIAHELRTPLSSIKLAAQFVAKFWNPLLTTYKMAKESKLPVEDIPAIRLTQLEGRIDSILQQTHFANSFIDLILGNLKEKEEIDISRFAVCDIQTSIKACLSSYPFYGEEVYLINVNLENNFDYIGDEFLMINVLNNLIKNSLYFVKDARKGEIYIWLECEESSNTLYFKDTAKGVPHDFLEHLFKSFYSKRHGGTGLGLAFCKKIMNSMGGGYYRFIGRG